MFYVLCSRLKIITVIILLILAFSAASSAEDETYPKRIISLTPATTEILFALGLDEEIIAVSSYCSWPSKAKEKIKVGSFSNPNIEKIISLKPDLVLVTGMEQEQIGNVFKSMEIRYINVDPKDIQELIDSIEIIGEVTGKAEKAREINTSIKDVLKKIEKSFLRKSCIKKPMIYMEIWHDPIMSPGRGSFVNDMIIKAGGISVTSDLKRSYSRIDPERIILANPDKIILAYMKSNKWVREYFSKRLGWENVKAVKDNKVYTCINPDIILRPGPRIAQGLIELYERFYETQLR
jgi:iron complex transport system substrate-binding protein